MKCDVDDRVPYFLTLITSFTNLQISCSTVCNKGVDAITSTCDDDRTNGVRNDSVESTGWETWGSDDIFTIIL